MGERELVYDEQFYGSFNAGMERSAGEVVPLVMRLVKPTDVVDVGCGEGVWLAAFRGAGVHRILGMDGPWVDSARLAIPADALRAVDLTGPLQTTDRLDRCVSLEVAEHLPQRSASAFVRMLVTLAPAVLFSEAIPVQRGAGHVNERWPTNRTNLFSLHDYVRLDPFRHVMWHNRDID